MKSTRRPPGCNTGTPDTSCPSLTSWTVCAEIVCASTGSLNTNAITPLSGTSVLLAGGSLRMTIGGVAVLTGARVAAVTPPALVVTIVTVSPSLAPTGTGSSPPSVIAAVTSDALAGLNTWAVTPPGTVPGGMATYVTLSLALFRRASPAVRARRDTSATWGVGLGARSAT